MIMKELWPNYSSEEERATWEPEMWALIPVITYSLAHTFKKVLE